MRNLYLANTDNDWFDFLKARQPWEEINFWKPSQQTFKAIDEGGLFVFRLKAPRNVIGGYGTLVSSINAPIRLAWDSLGEGNGLPNIDSLVRAIRRYRTSEHTSEHSLIGCRLLANPVFFDERDWFDVPSDWSNNIVTGKVYDTGSELGSHLLAEIERRTPSHVLFERDKRDFEGMADQSAMFTISPMPTLADRLGKATLIRPRLGQASFRLAVASAYGHCCALSDTRVLPALDAAHIRPFGCGGEHAFANALLLRKDIHGVLDAGFATIGPDRTFIVSPKVRTIFNNGNEYFRMNGKPLRVPVDERHHPSEDNFRWHRENCFVGA